jgi:WD40 repeat protein
LNENLVYLFLSRNTTTGPTRDVKKQLKLEKTLTGHAVEVRTLAILPNGDLVSGSSDLTIKMWDLTDGRLEKSFEFDEVVTALVVLPKRDSQKLAWGSDEGNISELDLGDGS